MEKQREFNRIANTRVFDVTALTGAYYFVSRPFFGPCWESYGFSQIFYVRAGEGKLTLENGESYPIHAGMMIYRPQGKRSFIEWEDSKVSYTIINFVCESPAMEAFGAAPLLLYGEESAILFDLARTAARAFEPLGINEPLTGHRLREDVPPVVLSFLYASLERFLAMVFCRLQGIGLLADESAKVSRHLRDSRLVEEVKAYLDEHAAEPLTVADICAQFWIGPSALTGKFRRGTGKSPIEYLIDRRIELAKNRIAESEQSFTELAAELGFSSVGYFSKCFKARVGMTPTQYSRAVSKRFATQNTWETKQ